MVRQARMPPLPRRRLVISLLLLPSVRRGGFDGGQSAGLHGNHPLDANAAAHDIALRDKPGVATESIGEEPNRRVVVLPRNV